MERDEYRYRIAPSEPIKRRTVTEDRSYLRNHDDPQIASEVEIDRLRGLLAEAHAGLLRALDYRAGTPEGLEIKADVRDALQRSGFTGPMGCVGDPVEVAPR